VQAWPPFVLVAGLLLIGLVADGDGLFGWSGRWRASITANGWLLYAGAVVATTAVTAVLNLDTSVAFLTPVLVYAAAVAARMTALCSTAASCCRTRPRCCCQERTSPA